MNQSISTISSGAYIDSREVAELIERTHYDLIKIIRRNIKFLIDGKISVNDFFLENTYVDNIGRSLPCFLLTKMGCELIANKLTGKKGTLFTAAYVKRFNELEREEKAELTLLEDQAEMMDFCINLRFIVSAMKTIGATTEQISTFYKSAIDILDEASAQLRGEANEGWYRATDIAKICGIFSLYGRPHKQAVSSILNENIFIDDEHIRVEEFLLGNRLVRRTLYNEYALHKVMEWLVDNNMPDEVYGFIRTFYIEYKETDYL